MTKRSQKRDNQYYLDRLLNEHPAIFADYQAGKFKSAAEALVVAGLRKPRSQLDVLSSAWTKASPTERDAFKAQIGCVAPTPVSVAPAVVSAVIAPPRLAQPAKGKGHLTPTLAADVTAIIARRGLKNGDVMREIGFSHLDASLGRAIARGEQIQNRLISALESWVQQNNAP
jgi:hypothetical protein